MTPPLVLLIDDEPLLRDVIFELIVEGGMRVRTADDGRDAVAAAVKHRPDVIVMDYSMPGLNGIDATRQLKADKRTRKIPVVLFTAEPVAEQAREAGCNAIVRKPCRADLLLTVLREQLQRE